jgi:hypothetical protein
MFSWVPACAGMTIKKVSTRTVKRSSLPVTFYNLLKANINLVNSLRVIPAKAGIQSPFETKRSFRILCFHNHILFILNSCMDPRLRGDDSEGGFIIIIQPLIKSDG